MTSVGLLVFRALVGMGIFIKPGIEKLTGYFSTVQHFPAPIHIAADDPVAYALLEDGICALLLLSGLFTWPVALMSLIDSLVTFMIGNQAAFVTERHPDQGTNISDMAIPADPDRRPFRDRLGGMLLQPLEEVQGVSWNISVG